MDALYTVDLRFNYSYDLVTICRRPVDVTNVKISPLYFQTPQLEKASYFANLFEFIVRRKMR